MVVLTKTDILTGFKISPKFEKKSSTQVVHEWSNGFVIVVSECTQSMNTCVCLLSFQSVLLHKTSKGSFINDNTKIWDFSDPPPLCHTCKPFALLTCVYLSMVSKVYGSILYDPSLDLRSISCIPVQIC